MKEIVLLLVVCHAFFLSAPWIIAESIALREIGIEKRMKPIDFDVRLADFLDAVKELENQGLIYGEVLVARDGQILLNLKSEGTAPSDGSQSSQFMIGSVSKQFFAVALLKALHGSSIYDVEQLKMADVKKRLHAPISQFLPEGSPIWDGNMPAWAKEVSLHHLLTHTSGIPSYTDAQGCEYSDLSDPRKRWFESYHSASEIIRLIVQDPLLFSPGSKYSYSNTGYVIIAEVIEAITYLPVSQYIQETLFDPLSLSSTASPVRGRWDELLHDPRLSRLVAPFKYDLRGDQKRLYPLVHCEDISVAKGGGSIISTSTDLLKWNQSLHKDKSVLPSELYSLFITANMDNYGYGIEITNNKIGMLLGHDGGIGSYRTLLFYMPAHDLSLIMLSNVCGDFDKVEEELKEVMESLLDTLPDEKERKQAAFKVLFEKYPSAGGFDVIAKKIDELFS